MIDPVAYLLLLMFVFGGWAIYWTNWGGEHCKKNKNED